MIPRAPISFKAPPTLELDPKPPFLPLPPFLPNPLLDDDELLALLIGTRCPCCVSSINSRAPLLPITPSLGRKCRSTGSIPSSEQSSGIRDKSSKDTKHKSARKKARKSTQLAVDMWWLGVIHRSISRGLCGSESTDPSCQTDALACGGNGEHQQTCHNIFQEQDRLLIKRICQKVLDSGYCSAAMIKDHEGRPVSLPRLTLLSTPPTPMSLLFTSTALSVKCRAKLDPKNTSVNLPSLSKEDTGSESAHSPCPMLHCPQPSILIAAPPPRNQWDFQTSSQPTTPASKDTVTPSPEQFRRSPSPPLRPSTPPPSQSTTPIQQTPLTMTMPQLVASLTLAHHKRCGFKPRSSKNSSKHSSKKKEGAHFNGGSVGHKCRTSLRHCADKQSPLRHAYFDDSIELAMLNL